MGGREGVGGGALLQLQCNQKEFVDDFWVVNERDRAFKTKEKLCWNGRCCHEEFTAIFGL